MSTEAHTPCDNKEYPDAPNTPNEDVAGEEADEGAKPQGTEEKERQTCQD